MQAQSQLEELRNQVEKLMMGMEPDSTDKERRMYLAGHIDTLLSCGVITTEAHETLYAEYAF